MAEDAAELQRLMHLYSYGQEYASARYTFSEGSLLLSVSCTHPSLLFSRAWLKLVEFRPRTRFQKYDQVIRKS